MTFMLEGKSVAREIEQRVRSDSGEIAKLLGRSPAAAAVLVGDDESSHSYYRSILRTFKRVGIDVHQHEISAEITNADLQDTIRELNDNDSIDGVIVFQPLPSHLNRELPAQCLSPDKDIDGITYHNAGRLAIGLPTLVPSTPWGGMEILRHYDIPLEGSNAVVVGRSPVVGQPMALMLLAANATVTVCHSRTKDLAEHTRNADIVVLAAGRPGVLSSDMVNPEATVIDFGVNFIDGQMVGDADASVKDVAKSITPVPGGTGVVTQRVLASNTLKAARSLYEERVANGVR